MRPCKTFLRSRVPAFYLETCTILSSVFGIWVVATTDLAACVLSSCAGQRRTCSSVATLSPHPIIYLHTDCSWKSNAWRISNRQEGRRRRRGRKRRRFSCEVDISNNKPARNLQNYNLPPRACVCVCVIRLKNWYNARKNSPKSFYFREYFPQTNVSRVLTFTI